MTNFINGYQKKVWQNQAVHIYKQSGKEKLGLISLPYGTVADITAFTLPGKVIKAILNCHYFNNNLNQADYGKYYGRCQSFTEDKTTIGVGEEGFAGYKGTQDKPYMDFVVLNNGETRAGDFNSWDYRKPEIAVGFAPAAVQMYHGEDVNWYSPECGYGKVTTPNTQSLLVKCADGKFALVAVSGKLDLFACRSFVKAYGCTDQAACDSGGSTQMLASGSKKVYTGRKIPTCLVIYEDIETTPEPPEIKPETQIKTRMVKCVKGTLNNGTEYPTRSHYTADWDRTGYKINVGDILEFDDVRPVHNKDDDSSFRICGGSRSDLIGRWFAYDKDYFH